MNIKKPISQDEIRKNQLQYRIKALEYTYLLTRSPTILGQLKVLKANQ